MTRTMLGIVFALALGACGGGGGGSVVSSGGSGGGGGGSEAVVTGVSTPSQVAVVTAVE